MKKVGKTAFLVLVLGLVAIGCGKKSGLEGKVADGMGNPIAGLKIIAKQVKPIKGYEQFETTTGLDGSFKFVGVYPTSAYTLLPWKQDTNFSASVNIQSGPEGETIMLPQPFTIRFMQTKDGIIKDSVAGVQWLPDPGRKDITWDEAQGYVQGLQTGGYSDWRLPSIAELEGLYDPSSKAEFKIDPLFQLSACCSWTSELYMSGDPMTAFIFSFDEGKVVLGNIGHLIDGKFYNLNKKCVLAVRTPK